MPHITLLLKINLALFTLPNARNFCNLIMLSKGIKIAEMYKRSISLYFETPWLIFIINPLAFTNQVKPHILPKEFKTFIEGLAAQIRTLFAISPITTVTTKINTLSALVK